MAAKKKSSTATHKSIADLRSMNSSELRTELSQAQKDLYVLEMKKELGELKQTHLVKNGRKYIAQVSTFLASSL